MLKHDKPYFFTVGKQGCWSGPVVGLNQIQLVYPAWTTTQVTQDLRACFAEKFQRY